MLPGTLLGSSQHSPNPYMELGGGRFAAGKEHDNGQKEQMEGRQREGTDLHPDKSKIRRL